MFFSCKYLTRGLKNRFYFSLIVALGIALPTALRAHVAYGIIYFLGVSSDYAEDGLVFSSSTQFGESHLLSHNHGETFAESNTGMKPALATGSFPNPASVAF